MDPYLADWIRRIAQPREELAGLPVCPYATGAEFSVQQVVDTDPVPPLDDFDLIIYQLDSTMAAQDVMAMATRLNRQRPDLVFLPDPRDRKTWINGVQTNNGHYNLILCQPRAKLAQARARLINTAYYSMWDQAYLDEIMNT